MLILPNVYAYFGLGPLIPIIGSAFWALFGLIIALLGIFFYPFKLLINKIKKRKSDDKKNQ
jgi:hypothetical protein